MKINFTFSKIVCALALLAMVFSSCGRSGYNSKLVQVDSLLSATQYEQADSLLKQCAPSNYSTQDPRTILLRQPTAPSILQLIISRSRVTKRNIPVRSSIKAVPTRSLETSRKQWNVTARQMILPTRMTYSIKLLVR